MSKKNKYGFRYTDKDDNTKNAIIYASNIEDAENSFYDFYGDSLGNYGNIIEIEELENYDY